METSQTVGPNKATKTHKKMAKISIVILQYNNSVDSLRCLESVKGLDYPDWSVIVVDNHSDNFHLNSIRMWVESHDNQRFSFIANNANLGYTGGNNVGIRQALERGSDYILILNPDTTVASDLLTKLVAAAEPERGIGIVGTFPGRIQWLKAELPLSDRLTPDSDFYLSGACLLVKKSVIERVGLLDENYFLYFEDADYCVRARRAGFQLKLVPAGLVQHQVSASTGALGAPLLLRYHFRNALYFNWRYAPLQYKIRLPFWSFWIILKQLAKLILQPAKRIAAKAILAGVMDFHLDRMGKI